MKTLLFFVCLIAVAFGACKDPTVMEFYSDYPLLTAAFLDTPVYQINGTCSHLDNTTSCCGPAADALIESGFNVLRIADEAIQAHLIDVVHTCFEVEAMWKSNISYYRSLDWCGSELTPVQCAAVNLIKEALLAKLELTITIMREFCAGFAHSAGTCLAEQIKYAAGLMCLGCENHDGTNPYITKDAQGMFHLTLSDDVCDDFYVGCKGMQEAIVQFYTDMKQAWPSIIVPSAPCYGQDLQTCICGHIIRGWENSINYDNFPDIEPETSSFLKEDTESFKLGMDLIKEGKVPAAKLLLGDLHSTQSYPEKVVKRVMVLPNKHIKINKAYETTNQYSSTGYNAIEIGSQSKLNTDWDIPSDSSSAILTSGVALLIGFLFFLM